MNEILFSLSARNDFKKRTVKRVLWKTASYLALGGLYAWDIEHQWLMVERRAMPLRGLGKGFDGATIAHVSDLHMSPIVREKYLLQFVALINSLNVDFVVITGDVLTGARTYARRVGKVLSRLEPKVATLACLGNHDYGMWHPSGLGGLAGLGDYVSEQLTDAGVMVLNNGSHIFRRGKSALQFVGVEDLWTPRYDPAAAFVKVDPRHPTVALVHNPDAAHDVASRGAQWVLAGHTHGKDTRRKPMRVMFVPAKHRHFVVGQYRLSKDSFLYVNRGLGYSQRLHKSHRPEITLFTLCEAS